MQKSQILIGIIVIIIGVLRYKGKNFTRRDLSMFRRYKVTTENKRIYGKQSGTGMIILGTMFIVGEYVYHYYNSTIGCIILILGFVLLFTIEINAFYKYIRNIH